MINEPSVFEPSKFYCRSLSEISQIEKGGRNENGRIAFLENALTCLESKWKRTCAMVCVFFIFALVANEEPW